MGGRPLPGRVAFRSARQRRHPFTTTNRRISPLVGQRTFAAKNCPLHWVVQWITASCLNCWIGSCQYGELVRADEPVPSFSAVSQMVRLISTTYAGFARDAKLQPIDFDTFIGNQRNPAPATTDFSSWDDLTNAYLSAQPRTTVRKPILDLILGSDNLVSTRFQACRLRRISCLKELRWTLQAAHRIRRVILNVGQQETIQTTALESITMFNETKANLIAANVWDIQFNLARK